MIFTLQPGITDYAAIEFRNENELLERSKNPEKTYIEEILPEKLKLYLKYADERSLWVDFKLILGTIFPGKIRIDGGRSS